MNFKERTEFLKKLITEAGQIMLGARSEGEASFSVKGGSANFVTKYDVAVQKFLIDGIKAQIPNAVFIAEEQENTKESLLCEHCFIIDPIDGTSNFMNGLNHSSISLAYVSFGKTVFGAVYDPYRNELFNATQGEGAFLWDTPIHASCRSGDRAIASVGTSPYYKYELGDKTFGLIKEVFLKYGDIRRLASAALDLSYLAAGRIDLFFEFKLSVWDYAAGELIVKEAGGTVTQIDGSPLSLEAPCSVFGGNSITHPELIKIAENYRI